VRNSVPTWLVSLHRKDLLEPHVLLNVADAEIAQGYRAYQKDHRDKLIRYLDEVAVPPESKSE